VTCWVLVTVVVTAGIAGWAGVMVCCVVVVVCDGGAEEQPLSSNAPPTRPATIRCWARGRSVILIIPGSGVYGWSVVVVVRVVMAGSTGAAVVVVRVTLSSATPCVLR